MKRKENNSVFFGRSLVFLLVVLFVLTGVQMGLSLARGYSRGVVLGEDSNFSNRDKKDNKDDKDNEGSNERAGKYDVVVPTIIITPELTTTPTATQSDGQAIEPVSVPVEVKSSGGNTVTTTTAVDRSTGETVRQIINKFGVNTSPAPARLAMPALKTTVKAVEEKTAGEILRELATLPSRTGSPPVRLRYRFINGQMTLVGETDTGEKTTLSASESASIIGKLARSAALDIKTGGSGESVFTKGQIRAVTELSLLVDLRTNLLTTETSTGIKTVPLLPDEAIKIAFASRVVDGVYPKKSNAEIAFSEAKNGRLVYQIDGMSKRKLFGLIPMTLRETALVDAANGQVSQPDKSLGKLLVELIAFPTK